MASGWLRHLSGTFAFHASVESFLSSVGDSPAQSPMRTRLLNRNVAVVSSYRQMEVILGSADAYTPQSINANVPYSAAQAYAVFMKPFSPGPNLLPSDGVSHTQQRKAWNQCMQRMPCTAIEEVVKGLVKDHFTALAGSTIDLYSSLKELAAKMLLKLFLDLDTTDRLFDEIVDLQENLLRGQFSMFPVSVDVKLWRSSREVGLDAMRKLQSLVVDELRLAPQVASTCPFFAAKAETWAKGENFNDVTIHVMLFTSSLAFRALASLISALILNVFVLQQNDRTLAVELAELPAVTRGIRLRGIQLETERLSPPIVGIMRRVSADQHIPAPEVNESSIQLPKCSDAWLYFVCAGHDQSVFGMDAERFRSDRFLGEGENKLETLAFSTGPRCCIGQSLSCSVCCAAIEMLLDHGIELQGSVVDKRVQAWLGWCADAQPEDWQRHMQQLPVQHPREPDMIQVLCRKPS